ncbi:MAG TPA: hypothetical protein VG276_16125 [Actinomycetes bacterium]|jgi:hypothetical protein|nr:hypothetical protein [Actinomycetes bacterium]
MRAPPRRALPLAAVLTLFVVLAATALAKGEGIWPGGATSATRPAPSAGGSAGTGGGASPAHSGRSSGAGSSSGPAATSPAARKGTTGTTDALFIWTGRDARAPADAVGRQLGPSAPVQVQLGLHLTAGAGRGLAAVRMRNLTGKPLPVAGTVQLLVTGPGMPVVVRQPVRLLIPAAQASTVRLSFRPPFPGVYRVRAIFVPS